MSELTKEEKLKEKYISALRSTEFNALENSKDESTKVCASILNEDFVPKTWGYNGMPRGANEKIAERWERPEKYMWTEHAERNAISNAAKVGIPLENSTIVVNVFPCLECARMIVQSGIKKVVSIQLDFTNERDLRWKDSFERSKQLFDECGVEVNLFTEEEVRFNKIRKIFEDDEVYLAKAIRRKNERISLAQTQEEKLEIKEEVINDLEPITSLSNNNIDKILNEKNNVDKKKKIKKTKKDINNKKVKIIISKNKNKEKNHKI